MAEIPSAQRHQSPAAGPRNVSTTVGPAPENAPTRGDPGGLSVAEILTSPHLTAAAHERSAAKITSVTPHRSTHASRWIMGAESRRALRPETAAPKRGRTNRGVAPSQS
jgi:hypothetical protein